MYLEMYLPFIVYGSVAGSDRRRLWRTVIATHESPHGWPQYSADILLQPCDDLNFKAHA